MKRLVHFLIICATLSIATIVCLVADPRDTVKDQGILVLPFIGGMALFATALEPLLGCDFLDKRIQGYSYTNLMLRAFFSGLAIFAAWVGLYYIGKRYEGHEMLLFVAGYVLAVAFGILGVVAGRNKAMEQASGWPSSDSGIASTEEILPRAQITLFFIYSVPLVFILYRGWKYFYPIYSLVCFAMGVLAIITWIMPQMQRKIFAPGISKQSIRNRLIFAVLLSFTSAIFLYFKCA